MLKKIAGVLLFVLFLFIAVKFYNYMSTDGFDDSGSITGFTCPDGWEQMPTDDSNGTCMAPCTPGNNSPQSFAYGPNAGGFPLNRRSGWDYCNDTYNGSDQSQTFSVKSATVGGPPIVAAVAAPVAPAPVAPVAPVAPMPFTCPAGWTQTPTDTMNGSCTAPCTPGNNSPQVFLYGPNAGGYPLNQRAGWDYCNDSNMGNQSAAFSVRSATVGGPPIVPAAMAQPMPVAPVAMAMAPPVPVPTPVPGSVVQAPVTVSVPAPVTAPTTMIPKVVIPYKCPDGFSQVPTNPTSGTCVAPCIPGNSSPKSFAYGPSSGGYPISRITGQSYCTTSKFKNMRNEFIKRTPTVELAATTVKEGFESLSPVDNIQGVSVENTTKIKDVATNAAEVMTDKLEANTIGLNITCASGDKPKISYIRNSKFGISSKDVNTLKGVRGRKQDFSCSEPKQNQYIFDPLTDT